MKLRQLAAWFTGVALLGTGATLLCAQPSQPAGEARPRIDRGKLRAQVIELRTEVEMLRFDYELARDGLLEEVKIERGLKMAGGLIGSFSAIQVAINKDAAQPPGGARRQETEQDRKKATEAAKAAEQEEKKNEAELTAVIAERKKELARKFKLLSEKRLDLEDAEQKYRESR